MSGINIVDLIGTYGGDESHCLSAWTSTYHELTEERRGRMGNLLKMLAENKHETPFEKSMLHFYVVCDTASHIHLLKHRIGVSINGESARYKELKDDKFYVPSDWPEDLKQKYIGDIEDSLSEYHWYLQQLEDKGFSRKRAKESARFILPYANQLGLDISYNFRSFIHFLDLRNKDDAQDEIHHIANRMLHLVKETNQFNLSLEAFGY